MSKPLLKIRCISCEQDFAWVRVMRLPDEFRAITGAAEWPADGVRTMVQFRTMREVRDDAGARQVKNSGPFEESLDAEGGCRTKAYCRRHSYWLEHAVLAQAIRDRVGVLKAVPGSPVTYSWSA